MHGVQLSDLTHRFGSRLLMDDLSLNVLSGEYLVILGESGSGKSTLLKMIAGLQTPDGGIIRIEGQDMSGIAPHRRNVSLLFQNDALYPHQSVRQNILFGAPKNADQTDLWDNVIRQTRTAELLDRQPNALSGGEKKRVGLAKAMLRNARVQLLDEPLSAIDPAHRSLLTADLRRMHQSSDATVVHVTHDAEEAFRLADRVAVLDAGLIRQVDPPDRLLAFPSHVAVTRLLMVFGSNEFSVQQGDPQSESVHLGPTDAYKAIRLVIPSSAIRLSSAPKDVDVSGHAERHLHREGQHWTTHGDVTCLRRLPSGDEIELVTDGITWQVRTIGQADVNLGRVRIDVDADLVHWFHESGHSIAANRRPAS